MYLIAVDGIDGAGKSTLCNALRDYIERTHAVPTIVTSDLGRSTEDSTSARAALMYGLCPMAELYAVLMARAQHLEEVIAPAIVAGKCVILDRWTLSTLAYQGAGAGIPESYIRAVAAPMQAITPDLQIILRLDVQTAMDRIKARGGPDPFEGRGRAYFERVAGFYNVASDPALVVDREPLSGGSVWTMGLDAHRSTDRMIEMLRPMLASLFAERCADAAA